MPVNLPEKNASNRSSEGDRDARGCRGRQDFPLLRLVPAVLGKQVGEDVAGAARHVNHRALLAQTAIVRKRQDQYYMGSVKKDLYIYVAQQ